MWLSSAPFFCNPASASGHFFVCLPMISTRDDNAEIFDVFFLQDQKTRKTGLSIPALSLPSLLTDMDSSSSSSLPKKQEKKFYERGGPFSFGGWRGSRKRISILSPSFCGVGCGRQWDWEERQLRKTTERESVADWLSGPDWVCFTKISSTTSTGAFAGRRPPQ